MNNDIPTPGERLVVGVDIGTTKICAVVASMDSRERIDIRGVGVAESDGLNRGVVVNIDKTVEAVKKRAIDEAEHSAGVDDARAWSSALRATTSRASRAAASSPWRAARSTATTCAVCWRTRKHVAMPADREILHVLPQEFIVDGQDGVADPIGMSWRPAGGERPHHHRARVGGQERVPLHREGGIRAWTTSSWSRSPRRTPSSTTMRRRSASCSSTSAEARPTSPSSRTRRSATRPSSPWPATRSRTTSARAWASCTTRPSG